MVAHRMSWLITLIAGILIVSCSAPAAPTTGPTQSALPVASPTQTTVQNPTATQTPFQIAVPTRAATQTASPTLAAAPTKPATKPAGTTKLNMDEIFPPGPGRDIVLDNCTTCHTFVPLVVLQYSQAQWDLSARNHRDRVPRLSDADFQAAFAYLAKTFPPGHPVPQLPQNLLDTWTDY